MKNSQISVFLFVVSMAVLMLAGIYFKSADWLHILAIVFTSYGIILLASGIINKGAKFKKNEFYRPFVSILIPAKNEENVIVETIRSLNNLKYYRKRKKNFEIVVINDGSTDRTCEVLEKLAGEISQLSVVNRAKNTAGGKSSALNDGLKYCRGEVIAVFDADTQVDPYFLSRTVPYLHQDNIAGAQGRVRIYNAGDNYISGLQEDEFAVFSHLLQTGREILGGMTALGGNGQLVKRNALDAVGGWNENSTTEDMDLTLRLALEGYKVRYCSGAYLWQEGIDNLLGLIRQRIRWADGMIKCIFDYFLRLFSSRISFVKKLDGMMSLARITIPLWIIAGYIYLIFSLFFGLKIYTSIPSVLFFYISAAFFLVMWVGIIKVAKNSIFLSALRVFRFWSGSFIWLIVVPIAFLKIFSSTEFYWDKTYHKGSKKTSKIVRETVLNTVSKDSSLSVK